MRRAYKEACPLIREFLSSVIEREKKKLASP
jgi:hypothetical protein